MNLSTPSPAAPAAAAQPLAPAALPVAAAATSPRPGNPAHAVASDGAEAPRFERALMQLLLGKAPAMADGAAPPLVDPAQDGARVSALPAPAPSTPDAEAAPPEAAATMPDLLLSGMLQPAAPVPLAAPLAPAASEVSDTDSAPSPLSSALAQALQPAPSAAHAAPLPLAANATAPAAPLAAAPQAAATQVAASAASAASAAPVRQPQPLQPLPVTAARVAPAPTEALASLPAEGAVFGLATAGADSSSRMPGAPGATSVTSAAPASAPQTLMEALGERIAVQVQRGSERVVIRLDPPMQGQIEISIRTDASGATQVHLSGSSGDLQRQLHAISDSLRQELVQRQAGDVSVQVGPSQREQDSQRERQQRQAAEQNPPGRALDDADDDNAARHFALAPDQDSR